jgi:hypothetical protein
MAELHEGHRPCRDIAGVKDRKIAAVLPPATPRRAASHRNLPNYNLYTV